MGKLTFLIPDSLEEQVRDHIRKKGDLSKIGVEALEKWLKEKEAEG